MSQPPFDIHKSLFVIDRLDGFMLIRDPDGIGARDLDAVGILAVCVFLNERIVLFLLYDHDAVRADQECFVGHERHDVLGMPGKAARFEVVDLISRDCSVNILSAVEDGRRTVVTNEGNGGFACIHVF